MAGIGIYVHATFILIFVLILYLVYGKSDYWYLMAFYTICYLILFTCVLLHELGHALTAKKFGIQTRSITLLPIGGVAQLEGIPEKPGQELLIAIAGPLVNVGIVLLLLPAFLLTGGSFSDIFLSLQTIFSDTGTDAISLSSVQILLLNVIVANGVLVIFNLIPAFPMDGGRILRALIAKRLEYTKATLIAARTGQVIAILFILSGASNWLGFTHWQIGATLPFIGVFVIIGAQAEYKMVLARHPHSGLKVRDAMQRHFHSVSSKESLKDVMRGISETDHHDIIVIEGQRLKGILQRYKLMQFLAANGSATLVEEVMTENTPSISQSQPLEYAISIMNTTRLNTLPVVENNICTGIITFESIQSILFNNYNQNIA